MNTYSTTYVDDTLMGVCNDIDCQISSLQYPTIFSFWGEWSLMDSHLFGICFTLSFIITISIFFLIVMNNIIDILLTLIRKIDRIVLNSHHKKELLFDIRSHKDEEKRCVLEDCNHAKAGYIYINTKIKPFCIAYFCEEHAVENCPTITITSNPLPQFL